MAEGKKSFIAYVDWKETFDSLPDDKAGQLVKHLFAYVNDENPVSADLLINAVFANIKNQLKRDLRKWEGLSLQRAETGRLGGIKSGEARRSKTKQTKQELHSRSKTKQNEHVTVNVNDNGRIEEKQNLSDSATQKYFFIDQVIQEFKKAYEESNELPYAVLNVGKERAAAGKLLKEFKEVHPDYDSTQTLSGLSIYFDRVVNINDSWLRTNMSLPILISKFNEINNILKNGKSSNNKGGSDKEFLRVIGQHISQ